MVGSIDELLLFCDDFIFNNKQINMADVGDELLDGDLDEAEFDDLDGDQEDALLADDEFESYESSQVIFRDSQSGDSEENVYHVIDQVHDDEEIIEDGVEDDVLDIAVGDELDETELDTSQATEQGWTDSSSRTNEDNQNDGSEGVGVSSSTHVLGARLSAAGESDDEDTEGRGSRFRSERTNVISLKGAIGSKNLSDIPDSLDKVRTPLNMAVMRDRGRGPRGSVRGRLGPHPMRGGMMGRGGPRRGPHMMPPPQMPPPGHKIHVNPHFRGGMHHGPTVWDNERLPPPPGCENFPPPMGSPHKDMGWGGSMPPHHMGRPPMSPHHHPHHPPGPHGPYPGPQGFPPHPPQGYEDPYRPMDPQQPNTPPGRIVQFNENSQLVTVENQHFQRQGYDQNYGPPNQFQPPPPHYNNNMYPPNQFNPPQRPNFPPQNNYQGPPQNYTGYPQPDYQPQHPQYQNYDNNWNSQQPGGDFYPPSQPQPQPPAFNHPQPQFQPPHPPFPNQAPNFRPPQKQFQNNPRGSVMKRLALRQPTIPIAPPKQMRFEHNKPAVNTRSNLQEIKTVDSLPDTTTKQDPELEIEEDEETKQYRLKIAEQKALREKILREKEARRLAAALEKQKQQAQSESNTNSIPAAVPVQQPAFPKPVQVQQKPILVQQQPVQRMQAQQQVRNMGRGRGNSVNRVVPLQGARQGPRVALKQVGKTGQNNAANLAKLPNMPQIQIQNIQGTVYKIVKVRTKDGSIVTRKTPIAITQGGVTTSLTKTVSNPTTGTITNSNRKVLLNNQGKTGAASILRGTTGARLIPTKNAQGRTLYTVQTTPNANIPKAAPQRLVIDNRPANAAVKVAAAPQLPDSSLVTIDNLSLSTTQAHIQKMAKQVGTLTSFSYEPEQKKATLRFQKVQEAKEFHNKFNRKMIDLSRIQVTVVPE